MKYKGDIFAPNSTWYQSGADRRVTHALIEMHRLTVPARNLVCINVNYIISNLATSRKVSLAISFLLIV